MGSKERTFYEMPENWERFTLTPVLEEKIRVIRKLIPSETKRILDLGCGNGLITNDLAKDHAVVGADWSRTALGYVVTPRVCTSSTALPVRPGVFDLVLCSELLEHLLEDDFLETVKEILRIHAPRLLVTVPNNENTHVNEVRCKECGHVFNVSHHHRSFSVSSLVECFPGYRVVASRVGGPPVRPYPLPLLRIRQRAGRRWYQVPADSKTMCPVCENTEFPPTPHNPVSFFCDGLNKMLSRRRPYWLYVLLQRSP
jgi:SAM-dependent methyltransferase